MWLGDNAPIGGEELSVFLQSNGPQMEARTQMPLSDSFYELALDSSYTFSSLPASAVIVLIKQLVPEKGMLFAKEVQKAQFAQGKRLDSLETYESILKALEIEVSVFKENWMSENNLKATEIEFLKAREFAQGFPTLLIKQNDSLQVLTSGYFDYESVEHYLKNNYF
ncbi:hypothetical protein KH5_10890 [Urechidicola sp. KH5]